jgi:hypothetical protein
MGKLKDADFWVNDEIYSALDYLINVVIISYVSALLIMICTVDENLLTYYKLLLLNVYLFCF